MYTSYLNFVSKIIKTPLNNSNFKSNKEYNKILEHVLIKQGKQYINLISKTITLFSQKYQLKILKNLL